MIQEIFSKLFIICEWVMRLAILNSLFLFFSCAGLLLFGISPAYTAMSTVFKRLYDGQDIPIFRSFYKIFKYEFFKSNKFGLIYAYIGILLFLNFLFTQTLPPQLQTVIMLVIVLFAFLLVSSMIYVFPLYIKFETTTWRLIKNSFIIALAFFPRTLATLFLIAVLIVICVYQPILIFIFGFSSLCAITVLNSKDCIQKIQPT